MEFFRWILIAAGIVLLAVAFLMNRSKTPSSFRRTNIAKPVVKDTSVGDMPEPAYDPLRNDFSVDSSTVDQYESSDDMKGYSDEQIFNELGVDELVVSELGVNDHPDSQANYESESFSPTSAASDDFEEIDIALDSESSGSRSRDESPARETARETASESARETAKVTSFASAVQAANAQDELVAADIDDLDNNFYEEFEAYAGPVQLEEFEEKLVSIHVVALSGRRFYGNDLKSLFDKHGYKFGRMSLYHCTLEGEKVFSVANMVKPGTFNEDQMRIFETPGITLFMRLPIELDSGVAFDFLLQEAKELAAELDGQLRDGNRNPLSEQTIQHMREDIQQYVFRTKRLLQPV